MFRRTRIEPIFPDTVRRLNYLIDKLKLTSYLEIGLGYGGTFANVDIRNKVGVDPHLWNPKLGDFEGVQLITSDEYFYRQWNSGIKFDLILLDGLHTAEQTYRDFVNSLHFAHEKTIWLIDDVMPNDAFSAIPDQAESARQRAAAGNTCTDWHGDVYKVVWMINAFHKNMTLRTIWQSQPQAVVRYSNENSLRVENATLTEIAKLTYEDTVSRRAEYNLGEEADILKECIAAAKQGSR
jgi:hypothetical protein